MSNGNDMAFPTPTDLAPNNSIQVGLNKREWMATKLAAAILSGAVVRGCPRHEWFDATQDGVLLADKLLRDLA